MILNKLARPLYRGAKPALAFYHQRVLGLQRQPPRFILVLAHMRSGSSLLAHLLMSHPHILGGGERNTAHARIEDLDALAAVLYLERRILFKRFPYVLDQINHSRFTPIPELLNHPRIRVVFLLRQPKPAIGSMVRTFGPIYGDWPLERAVETYTERVTTMTRLASAMKKPWFFTTYEDLIDRSAEVLVGLTRFLGLDLPLQDRYRLWPHSGQRGDPSARIFEGAIVKKTQPACPDIPANQGDRVQRAYASCLAALADKP